MSVTHHRCPKQFRRCPLPPTLQGGTSWSPRGRTPSVTPRSDASSTSGPAAAGNTPLTIRHQTPPVVLSLSDVLTRMTVQNTRTWGQLTWNQQEIVRLRQLLEDNGIEAPKGGTLSARAEDSRSAMVAERDAGV